MIKQLIKTFTILLALCMVVSTLNLIVLANNDKTLAQQVPETLTLDHIQSQEDSAYSLQSITKERDIAFTAEKIPDSNLTWDLTNGVLTISGTGDMPDSTTPWAGRQPEITEVVIEEGVTSIGKFAFSYCTNLNTIQIPNTVTRIDDCAFQMSGIVSVKIPGSVKSIGLDAFYACSNLTTLELSEGLERIYPRAFYMCTGLTSVTIPGTVTSWEGDWDTSTVYNGAFQGCTSLSEVVLSEGLKEIGQWTFTHCSALTDIQLPSTLEGISYQAFNGTSLKRVRIPASVTWMAQLAFNNLDLIVIEQVQNRGTGTYMDFGDLETKVNGYHSPHNSNNTPLITYVLDDLTGGVKNAYQYTGATNSFVAYTVGGNFTMGINELPVHDRLAPLEKEGYRFLGWSSSLNNSDMLETDENGYWIPVFTSTNSYSPTYCYALWEQIIYNTLTVRYVNQNGEIIQEEVTTLEEGSAYDVTPLSIDGYSYVGPTEDSAALKGTITGDLVVTLQYAPVPVNYTLTVHYVDENGNLIQADNVITLVNGNEYTVTVLPIDGYDYVGPTADSAPLTGTIMGNTVITLQYIASRADIPQTGDSIVLWSAASVIMSLALLTLFLSCKRRRNGTK